MLNTDDSWLNPSKRAKEYLDQVLEGDSNPEGLVVLNKKIKSKEENRRVAAEKKGTVTDFSKPAATNDDLIGVDEARSADPVLEQVTERQKMRLLIFTKDKSMLRKGSLSYQRIAGEREVFYEMHIIILGVADAKAEAGTVLRPFENVWVYQTSSPHWWGQIYEAYKIAETQLVFSGGFRADIVIADDLFETGLVGWHVAKKHTRPFQLHINEDFFDEEYVESHEHPFFYPIAVWHLLRNVGSVRTRTDFQRQAVIERKPELEPYTEILPTYYNLRVWKDLSPSLDLHERYPKFKFIILHVSSMRPTSHSMEALIGVAKILKRYPTLGMVIVGNGPLRGDLERQVIALGLGNQVEFEPMPAEVISHLKSANVFIHLSEDGAEEDWILEAAVSRIPLIASSTGLAGKLFQDGESACLCLPGDIACIGEGLNRYLNENQERASFALNASEIVFERIEQDYGVYLESYRDSVERSMIVPS